MQDFGKDGGGEKEKIFAIELFEIFLHYVFSKMSFYGHRFLEG